MDPTSPTTTCSSTSGHGSASPQPCQGKGECTSPLKCGIYSSTTQPAIKKPDGTIDPNKMVVIDAAIGWKQPNGFYYPPAFTYRHSAFFKTVPEALEDLNMCFSFGPDDGFKEPKLRLGGCRHNVIDRTRNYIFGDMFDLANWATISGPDNPKTPLPIGPIDFTTILIDLDASLTGASGVISDGGTCTCNMACQTADGIPGLCRPAARAQRHE